VETRRRRIFGQDVEPALAIAILSLEPAKSPIGWRSEEVVNRRELDMSATL